MDFLDFRDFYIDLCGFLGLFGFLWIFQIAEDFCGFL